MSFCGVRATSRRLQCRLKAAKNIVQSCHDHDDALLAGRGVSLASKFRLTYSMMLNLLRVEDLKVRR